jgi:hypothetical protein
VSHHVLGVHIALPVTNQLMETDLEIDDEEHLKYD